MAQPGGFDLPESWQPVAYAIGVIGALLFAVGGYIRKFIEKPARPDTTEVAVVGGALADRAAMERLAESLDEIGALLRKLMEQQERHHRERDLDTVHRRMDDLQKLLTTLNGRD